MTAKLAIEIPVAFDAGGQYLLDTLERRAAAAVTALNFIAIAPVAYHSRGAEFCVKEMQRVAVNLIAALRTREAFEDSMDAMAARLASARDMPPVDAIAENGTPPIGDVVDAEIVGHAVEQIEGGGEVLLDVATGEITNAESMEIAPEAIIAMDDAERDAVTRYDAAAERERIAAIDERNADDEANAMLPWNHPAYFDGSLDEPTPADVDAPPSRESSEGGE